ncbi:hypothetical protein CRG98_047803 [Punica granatum]|uniref:Uncharacterized protein n=1 Tax=Punica granatum TaxID=22663 RepID=A0A2I0HK00_PUNGR|nr:hypothetical protein CRG98_047803 [Punica granatum]
MQKNALQKHRSRGKLAGNRSAGGAWKIPVIGEPEQRGAGGRTVKRISPFRGEIVSKFREILEVAGSKSRKSMWGSFVFKTHNAERGELMMSI